MEYGNTPEDERTRQRVNEAAPAYIALREYDQAYAARTRLSAKNQITLPVAMLRRLGIRAGDELDLTIYDGAIEVRKRLEGGKLLDWLQGSLAEVPEWQTEADIAAYVRGERDSWEREWDKE